MLLGKAAFLFVFNLVNEANCRTNRKDKRKKDKRSNKTCRSVRDIVTFFLWISFKFVHMYRLLYLQIVYGKSKKKSSYKERFRPCTHIVCI